jgi:Phosphotransferase enzyme family
MEQREQPSAALIETWCRRWLGAEPTDILFHQGHLSQVTGLRLANGVGVVLKVRPPSARLGGCVAVQRHLWAAGFPCPEPLAGPAPLGPFSATAELLIEGGLQLELIEDSPRLFAEALARLVSLAPPVASVPALEPSLPWVGWDHVEPGTWPVPDDIDIDLNAHVGPAWLEDAGVRVRRRLNRPSALPIVVGHADWESQNMRWLERRLHVVHDWDSIVAHREATIAGAASAVFTATGAPNTSATVEESESFLMAYARARGQPWTHEESELAWAAGLWVRVFNAKKATLRPGGETPSPSRLRLEAEVDERLRRAGA